MFGWVVKVCIFWVFVGGFVICGVIMNGFVGIYFILSLYDYGIGEMIVVGLFVVVGVFDVVGMIVFGWLMDWVNLCILFVVYYVGCGVLLLLLLFLLNVILVG